MSKVTIEVASPDPMWAKSEIGGRKGQGMDYQPKFCKESKNGKPIHIGPTVSVIVTSDKGDILSRQSATIVVKGDGEIMLRSYQESPAELEKKT